MNESERDMANTPNRRLSLSGGSPMSQEHRKSVAPVNKNDISGLSALPYKRDETGRSSMNKFSTLLFFLPDRSLTSERVPRNRDPNVGYSPHLSRATDIGNRFELHREISKEKLSLDNASRKASFYNDFIAKYYSPEEDRPALERQSSQPLLTPESFQTPAVSGVSTPEDGPASLREDVEHIENSQEG